MVARLIYADSEKSADMYYATRLFAPDPFLFLQDEEARRHIVLSSLEVDRARRVAQVDRVHQWSPLEKRFKESFPDQDPRVSALTAFFLEERGVTVVETPFDFPCGLADALRTRGITVHPVTDVFWPERATKNVDEVVALDEAQRITGLGMHAGIEMIRSAEIGSDNVLSLGDEPLTSERVRAEINATLVRHGGMPSHTIVAGGLQAADPHEKGYGLLRAHTAIILDIFPRVEKSGYWGDMSRTICKGEAPVRVRDAWEAVYQAQQQAKTEIMDGASGKAIHDRVTQLLTDAGFPTGPTPDGLQGGFFHGTGHGLGLEIHESPRISTRDQTLKLGHVVTVEPGLYYPDWGGVRLEDVVVVEEEGCRTLTDFPKFLEV
jgi:Xaa-Pro aminopeptidase